MSRFDKSAIAITLTIFLVLVVFSLLQPHSDPEPVELKCPTPPPVERVYTPSEAMVKVSVYQDGQRSYGHGTIVHHNDQIFVLTSSMLFTKDRDSIIIDQDEHSFGAEILYKNDVWGLVALDCPLIEMNIPFVELNGDPNIPPGVPVSVGDLYIANTLEYINDDWVLLDNSLPPKATGMPVTQNDALVGVVVGINRINMEQAIMVGNRALKKFCDEATLMNAPPVLYLPDNPNLLEDIDG